MVQQVALLYLRDGAAYLSSVLIIGKIVNSDVFIHLFAKICNHFKHPYMKEATPQRNTFPHIF